MLVRIILFEGIEGQIRGAQGSVGSLLCASMKVLE